MSDPGEAGASLGDGIERAAETILLRRPAAALTGAGISSESEIPTFREKGGLWDRFDPAEYASAAAFEQDPARVWRMLKELDGQCASAEPNEGHRALARLEELGVLAGIVTQNVDGLHQRGGSRTVHEFHGGRETLHCTGCGAPFRREEISLDTLPPRCGCGGALKPDVVLFGDPIPRAPFDAARELALRCGAILAVGTSAGVYPAAEIPVLARAAGAALIEVNPEPTPLTHLAELSLRGSASTILPAIVRRVEVGLARVDGDAT
jgi:NAD-dependent deacetylase